MTKFVIISDTHNKLSNFEKILDIVNSVDLLVHLGDHCTDILKYKKRLKTESIAVRGNCDYFTDCPEFRYITIGNKKIMFNHGDRFGVKNGSISLMKDFAKNESCDYVFYGHTHAPDTRMLEGITFINPGSLSLPRNSFASYCMLTENEGKIKTEIFNV